MIALACAGAGMVVSVITHTGLGLGIAAVIISWSKGLLLPALFLIMITSLILGMGLPTTPAYIIAITIGGPALSVMKCDLLASHLFVGAAIAGAEPLRTGWEATKLAIVGFLVPYVFIYNQALLMQGTVIEIITVFLLLLASTYFLAGSLSGFLVRKLNLWQRSLLFLIGLFLFFINTVYTLYDTILAGALLLAALTYLIWKRLKSAKGNNDTNTGLTP